MTETERSVDTVEESVTNHAEDEPPESIDDFVTEASVKEKELAFSIDYDAEDLRQKVLHRNKDTSLSAVANVFDQIQDWVEDVDDEDWELNQFTSKITIVVQRRQTDRDGTEGASQSE